MILHKCIKRRILLVFIIFNLLLFKFPQVNPTFKITANESMLLIAENTADNILAQDLTHKINITGKIKNIKPSDDLNKLFIEENYLNNYSIIIMILNRIASPFNNTLIYSLENFVNNGGIFVFISTQIWRFPNSFHELLKLSINPGQKEWPLGNTTEEITLTIVNDSYCQLPFHFNVNSNFTLLAGIGISTPIEDFYRVAISQNTPYGNMSINAFGKEKGFIIAAPISLINTVSTTFTNFLTSLITAGINYVADSLNSSNISTSKSNPLIIPFFNISEDTLKTGIVVGSSAAFIIGLVYIVKKLTIQISVDSIPKDRSWFFSLILGPIIWIGHIVYPPILRRLDTYNVYENETRKKIIDVLEDRDFLHFRELKRELDNIGTSSLKWHLQVLEDFEIIKRQVFGQYEIYYLRENNIDDDFLELYFTIISGLGYRVAKAFKESSSWDLNILAEYLEAPKESVRYHCKKFQKINMIKAKNNRYFLDISKRDLLMEVLYRRSKTNGH